MEGVAHVDIKGRGQLLLVSLLKGQTVAKKIISIILILLGLTVLGLGIGSGTIWKPEQAVTLKTGELDNALLVATNPGVVHQVNSRFEMTVTAPDGGDVALVVGNTVDVAGWIGRDAHWLVTGATDWQNLGTQFVAEKADPDAEPEDAEKEPATDEEETPPVSPIANLAKSDMWYQVVEGKDTVTLTMDKVPDNVIFLAGSLDPQATKAPEISLTWDREVATPLMLPGILAGALLLAVGILLLIDSLRHTPDWTELEAAANAEGGGGSKKTDSELGSDPDLVTAGAEDPQTPAEIVAAWGGGSGSVDDPDDADLGAPLTTGSGSEASSFAPKTSAALLHGDDPFDVDLAAAELDGEESQDYEVTVLDPEETVAEDVSAEEAEVAAPGAEELEVEEPDAYEADAYEADTEDEPFVFAPVTLDFTGEANEQDPAFEADSGPGVTSPDAGEPEAAETDEALVANEPATTQDAPEIESWFGRLFGKKAKAPKPLRALTPLEPLATEDAGAEFAVPSEPFAPPLVADDTVTAEPDQETQAALEVFAAMDEPDVTTGALQAAGLTRRQLREMRERKEQAAQRNVPTTTGSLDFGGPVTPAATAPERPSWLPEGSDSTSASSWRAAWGVRPEGMAAASLSVPAPPAEPTVLPDSDVDAAGETSTQDGSESQTDAATEKAAPRPTTRRALYSAYREAAERIANEDAEQEQTK